MRMISVQSSYDYATLKPQLEAMLEALGGSATIGRGCRVLIKPNLLAPATPDKAMLTHPLIVRCVAEYVLDRGGVPHVGDSPAMGSFERILKESGIRDALAGLPVRFEEFTRPQAIEVPEPFRRIELAAEALEADVVINLPKLKSHSQMLLTLAVKNLFGCVVGMRKPEWHLRTGVDREVFATLLLRICEAVNPAISILDGILAMEGQGPGKGGKPRPIGVIMGSTDPLAIDFAVCEMLGIDPQRVPTNKAAVELGKAPAYSVEGPIPRVEGFALPEITPLVFGPVWSQGLLRRHMVQRPVVQPERCRLCGDCGKYCPAKAISLEGAVAFDYEKCIRCYCCIEVCPHAALGTEEPLLGRMLSRLMKLWTGR